MSDNKYQKGNIYMITDVAYQERYYGSTIEPLTKRMIHHKHKFFHLDYEDKPFFRSVNYIFDKFGFENCKIELVENFPCNSKEELTKREGFYIQSNDCVNKHIAGRTKEEYKEQTRERKNERQLEYYSENKEEALLKQKKYRLAIPEKIKGEEKNSIMKRQKICDNRILYVGVENQFRIAQHQDITRQKNIKTG